ncbi:MAG: hypothetical protein IJR82_00820 [Bacilli bacterium]|nr:hypothetical protein [Bacilli bacterium]
MKKILLLFLIIILVFLIYYFNRDKKKYILSIGDEYIYNTSLNDKISFYKKNKLLEKEVIFKNKGDYRVIDLINDINDNVKFKYNGKSYTIDNALIKSDILLISIGYNDLKYCLSFCSYDYIDELMNDFDNLFHLIREYNKEKIYFINLLRIEDIKLTNYIDERFSMIAKKYNILIINDNFTI